MIKDAVLSKDSRYRYQLRRQWDTQKPMVLFVGLNPSTADADNDDPTIRRCIGFAQREGFGGFIMVNLFAYRATSPSDMQMSPSATGFENDMWINKSILECGAVIACWGNHGSHLQRDIEVNEILKSHSDRIPVLCFGLTSMGQPKHPLYLSSTTPLINYFPSLRYTLTNPKGD